jgi:hypothetical protein
LDQGVGLSSNQSAPCREKFSFSLRLEPEQFRKMDFAALKRMVRITPCVMPTSFIGDIHDSLRTSPANGIPLDYDPIQLNRIMI